MWPIIIALLPVLLLIGMVWGAKRRRRRDERLIRHWADEQGYAILRIKRPLPSLRMVFLWFFTGWAGISSLCGALSYPVFVQDDQGGQFTLEVTVRPRSDSVEARRR